MKMRSRKVIEVAKNILAAVMVLLLLVSSYVGCFEGKEEEGTTERSYGCALVEVLEGKWPVGSYRAARFVGTNITFEFPEEWGCYAIPSDSEEARIEDYKGGRDYNNAFIDVEIEVYAEDSSYGNNVPESPTLDPDLKLSKDNISGVRIYESKYNIDQNTGFIEGLIYAVDTKKSIKVNFESDKGRSLEEYIAVINHFIDTLKVDFDRLFSFPPYWAY